MCSEVRKGITGWFIPCQISLHSVYSLYPVRGHKTTTSCMHVGLVTMANQRVLEESGNKLKQTTIERVVAKNQSVARQMHAAESLKVIEHPRSYLL